VLLTSNSSRRRPDQDRWTELSIYRADPADDPNLVAPVYTVEIVGRSCRPGEVDRTRVEATTSPHFVVDLCALRDKVTGVPTLTAVGRKCLLEAAELDPALQAALDEFLAGQAA